MPPNPLLPVPGESFPFMDLDKLKSPEQVESNRRTQMSMAKTRLTNVTTAETNRLAYKDMKLKYYLAGTLLFYLVIIVGAIIIQSVSIIFDFASAFAITATAFIFPGMFYLKAV